MRKKGEDGGERRSHAAHSCYPDNQDHTDMSELNVCMEVNHKLMCFLYYVIFAPKFLRY